MFHVVIPTRYAATRLPGKPLADIGGRPMIQWVWECARASGARSVVVAADDARIIKVARGFGADCEMTSASCASGTDRVAEVIERRGLGADEIIVNLQGDEPLTPAGLVADLAASLRAEPEADMASAVAPITDIAEFLDPNCVKALRGIGGDALYFSRAPVPWPRDNLRGSQPASFAGAWRHVGIYAFRVCSLRQFAAWPPTPLEQIEKLEQLRALEHGMQIHLMTVAESPPAGVDTAEDLERVRRVLGVK